MFNVHIVGVSIGAEIQRYRQLLMSFGQCVLRRNCCDAVVNKMRGVSLSRDINVPDAM